jgi:hypothetical protein
MIRRLFAATALLAALAAPATLHAQEAPTVVAEESVGNPLWGYLAFGALAGLGLMILCRSSRRT